MPKSVKTRLARERALEIIIEQGGVTVRGLAQRLRDEGVYSVGEKTFNVGRASVAFARSRIKELSRMGKIKSKPNPALRGSEIWYSVENG